MKTINKFLGSAKKSFKAFYKELQEWGAAASYAIHKK